MRDKTSRDSIRNTMITAINPIELARVKNEIEMFSNQLQNMRIPFLEKKIRIAEFIYNLLYKKYHTLNEYPEGYNSNEMGMFVYLYKVSINFISSDKPLTKDERLLSEEIQKTRNQLEQRLKMLLSRTCSPEISDGGYQILELPQLSDIPFINSSIGINLRFKVSELEKRQSLVELLLDREIERLDEEFSGPNDIEDERRKDETMISLLDWLNLELKTINEIYQTESLLDIRPESSLRLDRTFRPQVS